MLADKPSIVISLDQNHFFVGEMVTGKVTLLNPDPNLHGHMLLLRIRGAEKTFIRGGDSGGSDESNEDHVLLKSVIPLADLRTKPKIPVGTFDYPFSFYLPSDLPGSFYGTLDGANELKSNKTKSDFAVYYTLKAYLDQSFAPRVEEKINLIVARRHIHEISQIKEFTERTFKLSRGKLRLSTILEKNVFIPGESIRVHLDIDNTSTRTVNEIYINLYQALQIHAGPLSAVIARKLYGEKFEGVSSKTRKELDFQFRIKEEIQPSVKSKLFDCQYHLEIECGVNYGRNLRSLPEIQIVMPPPTPTAFRGSFKAVWEHKKTTPIRTPIDTSRKESFTGDVGSEEEDEEEYEDIHSPIMSFGEVGPAKTVLRAGGSIGTHMTPTHGPTGAEIKPDIDNPAHRGEKGSGGATHKILPGTTAAAASH